MIVSQPFLILTSILDHISDKLKIFITVLAISTIVLFKERLNGYFFIQT